MESTPDGRDVVATLADATDAPPHLVLDRLTDFLDAQDLGAGPIEWERVGEGHSNLTYRLRRGEETFVLRRGPRPPFPPSAHDMLREARVQQLVGTQGVRVPEVLAVCADEAVLGVPFYLTRWIDGVVLTSVVPDELDSLEDRRAVSVSLVDALLELHAVDVSSGPLATFGRPDGFLGRQVSRFTQLWDVNATRVLPEVHELGSWLKANLPSSQTASVVHGDFRLGNVMLQQCSPVGVSAILDWEMSTVGDPLTDLGYLSATYSDADGLETPLHLSPVTARPGFLTSDDLVTHYAARSPLDLSQLNWYQALALWKGAVFCEAIYGRWLSGERPEDTTFAPSLGGGVPRLLEAAVRFARL